MPRNGFCCQLRANARSDRPSSPRSGSLYTRGVTTAHDPSTEINPNLILGAAFVLVIAAFGVVAGIILASEAESKKDPAAEVQK
jgi:hypothetical protein